MRNVIAVVLCVCLCVLSVIHNNYYSSKGRIMLPTKESSSFYLYLTKKIKKAFLIKLLFHSEFMACHDILRTRVVGLIFIKAFKTC